jgi:hypothetical protein
MIGTIDISTDRLINTVAIFSSSSSMHKSFLQTHKHTHIHTYTHTYAHTYTHTHTQDLADHAGSQGTQTRSENDKVRVLLHYILSLSFFYAFSFSGTRQLIFLCGHRNIHIRSISCPSTTPFLTITHPTPPYSALFNPHLTLYQQFSTSSPLPSSTPSLTQFHLAVRYLTQYQKPTQP